MTILLQQAFESLRDLPDDVQDDLARMLLQLSGVDQPAITLDAAEAASLDLSLQEADRGAFATDAEIRAIWAKHGLLKLRYTNRAAAELDAVLSSLDAASPQGARRVRKRLQDTIDLLLRYPSAGRLTTKRQLRRITAFPYPYVIFYRASPTDIVIHGIRHTARKPVASTTL